MGRGQGAATPGVRRQGAALESSSPSGLPETVQHAAANGGWDKEVARPPHLPALALCFLAAPLRLLGALNLPVVGLERVALRSGGRPSSAVTGMAGVALLCTEPGKRA